MSNNNQKEYLNSSNNAPKIDKLYNTRNFIKARIEQDKQRAELQDFSAITQSQNVFKSLETD